MQSSSAAVLPAPEPVAPTAAAPPVPLVLFSLADRAFALPAGSVVQIAPAESLQEAVAGPAWRRGTVRQNGQEVEVLDLRVFLRMRATQTSADRHLITVRLGQGDRRCGLLAQRVWRVQALPLVPLVVPASWRNGPGSTFLRGVLAYEGRPLFLLDIDRLLTGPELAGEP